MKVIFDYWQVISHYPDQFMRLGSALISEGHTVEIVSAVGKVRAGTVEKEVRKLGFEYPVHEVIFNDPSESPQLKLKKCLELGADMIFDDRDDVCRLLNQHGILALRVGRKDNSTYDLKAEIE